MTEAYGRMTKERVFAEGKLVLRVVDYVKRGMAGPSKFTPKWEGPLVIREVHPNGITVWPRWMARTYWIPSMGNG